MPFSSTRFSIVLKYKSGILAVAFFEVRSHVLFRYFAATQIAWISGHVPLMFAVMVIFKPIECSELLTAGRALVFWTLEGDMRTIIGPRILPLVRTLRVVVRLSQMVTEYVIAHVWVAFTQPLHEAYKVSVLICRWLDRPVHSFEMSQSTQTTSFFFQVAQHLEQLVRSHVPFLRSRSHCCLCRFG